MNTQQTPIEIAVKSPTKTHLMGIVGLKLGLLEIISASGKSPTSDSTDPLSVRSLADQVGASLRTVETTLARMVREGLISVAQSKRGRGGWVSYSIAPGLLQEIQKAQADGTWPSTLSAQLRTVRSGGWHTPLVGAESHSRLTGFSGNLGTGLGSRSRVVQNSQEIPDEWLEVDCALLHQEQVMFGPSHIRQVWKWGNVSLDELRLSIEAFAFDIRVNRKTIRMGLLNGFMEILKSGSYGPPANFETQADTVRRQNIDRLEAYRARQKDLDRRESDLAFSLWLGGMSEARLRQWMPEELQNQPLESHAVLSSLRLIYEQMPRKGV
jgi:hypothetical protein